MNHVQDIIETEAFKELKEYRHHNTNRYDHCLTVGYKSFVIANRLGLDARSVARAGVLHDFFFYDTKYMDCSMRTHLREHPAIALENAKKLTTINEMEEDIILSHMYLVNSEHMPRYRESMIVCMVDKYCSAEEKFHFQQIKSMLISYRYGL